MGSIKYRIPNWAKFNPRSDRANFTWFRLENSLFGDQAFFTLSDTQKVLWMFLMCEASKKNRDNGELQIAYIAAITGQKPTQIVKDFNAVCACGLMTAESRHDDGVSPGVIPATRRDVTNETNETNAHDFESVYKKFPRKLGKAEGLKKLQREVKTPEDFSSLSKAVDRFIDFHEKAGTDSKFIPYFSTFVSSWRDWLDPETGSAFETTFSIEKILANKAREASA